MLIFGSKIQINIDAKINIFYVQKFKWFISLIKFLKIRFGAKIIFTFLNIFTYLHQCATYSQISSEWNANVNSNYEISTWHHLDHWKTRSKILLGSLEKCAKSSWDDASPSLPIKVGWYQTFSQLHDNGKILRGR